jgi:hypothetical protein
MELSAFNGSLCNVASFRSINQHYFGVSTVRG